MLRLLLLRHAKSSWNDMSVPDFDRDLNSRGRAAAPLVAQHMRKAALTPERILCSSALRTRETLAAMLPYLAGDLDIHMARALYDTDADSVLDIIRDHGGDAATLLVIGHNPATQDLTLALAGSGDGALITEVGEKFPTAGLAVLDFDIADWSALAPGSGRLTAFLRPRDLEAGAGAAAD